MASYKDKSEMAMTVDSADAADNSSGELANGVVIDHGLQRSLKQRHLQMIALGGVVG
jgi:amino acid permease